MQISLSLSLSHISKNRINTSIPLKRSCLSVRVFVYIGYVTGSQCIYPHHNRRERERGGARDRDRGGARDRDRERE